MKSQNVVSSIRLSLKHVFKRVLSASCASVVGTALCWLLVKWVPTNSGDLLVYVGEHFLFTHHSFPIDCFILLNFVPAASISDRVAGLRRDEQTPWSRWVLRERQRL